MKEVYLKKGAGRSLKAGGLWVYDNEIDEARSSVSGEANGGIVTLRDFDGFFLGYGFCNENSKIRVRLLSRKEGEPVDDTLLKRRAEAAWNYRKRVMASTEDLSACRIIFGEADFLPGLTVDRFGDVLVVESLALGIDLLKERILGALIDVLSLDGVTIREVYERSDSKERDLEGMPRVKRWLDLPGRAKSGGETLIPITENGIRYLVDIAEGQKTGFFLDQKYNRLAVQRLCRGARVLDCFTHTGAFALNAAKGGAASVLAVDASETALSQARENVRLNGLDEIVSLKRADVFELLPALQEQGEQYDVVILDPPAFTKARSSVKKAASGYREINTRGMQLVKNGGFLATCTCSHFMEEGLFAATVHEAAKRAHVRLRQVEFRQQAPDHPILWTGEDNSYYLKFYIFQVLRER
ncbi:MAG: class I SAM-dependent rRNA methyltransferase [Lachnospiraceae bacterium]|nr:class I SAM-dependent rRNA methyltransferase [Lachnospiraceae bacterium]